MQSHYLLLITAFINSGTIMDVLSLAGILFVEWMSCGYSGWELIPHLVGVISHFTMC